jgi:aminoglycoside phosphotransferase (APT) family kinase protein
MTIDPHALDEAALGKYLENHVDGFLNLQSISKFGDGQSNPTYLISAQSGKYVLRTKPPGKLLKSAHAVDREFRVMQALQNTDVPVPKMFHLSDEGNPIGRMFFVMEFLQGRIFWDPKIPELNNAERGRIYDAMNKTLAALHSVDVGRVGLSDYGKPGSYFERQVSRWSSQYRASELKSIPQMNELILWLDVNMVEDDGQISIVHGDYRIDNMIFAENSNNMLGLLDWELSTLGHPLADLAYQCMQWRMPSEGGIRGFGDVNRSSLGIPTEAEYVEKYCHRRNIGKIENWNFYLAFAFFRLAAILQGVVKRAEDGNASNPESRAMMEKAVPFLAQAALDTIEAK